jgi:hypothetical protein
VVFEKKTTALNPAVGAAAEQSSQNMYVESIADLERKINEEIDHPGVCEVDNAGGNGIPESDWTDKQDEEEIYRIMRQMADPGYLPTMNMAQLYDQVYRAKPPVIENLLYPGTYLFVGAPKLGKSFLMLQIAYHAATGTPLWEYPARQNTVLYLALEDDHRRLQDRLYRMFGTECTEHLYFATRADPLNGNLITQMRSFISSHQGTGLIIIDTLQKVRECADDRYSYASDYDVITKLKDFAEQSGICLLLVHHTRKQQADDKFEMISGTHGLLGAADGAFLLHKEKRTSCEAVLDISGRDQPDQRLHLNRNPETLLWDLETADMQVIRERPEPVLSAVAQLVTEESPTWTGTPTELAAAVGSDLPPNKLTMKLGINASRLFNEYGISFEKTRTRSSRQIMLRRNVTGA